MLLFFLVQVNGGDHVVGVDGHNSPVKIMMTTTIIEVAATVMMIIAIIVCQRGCNRVSNDGNGKYYNIRIMMTRRQS